jgi:hypothetical protein
MKSGFETKHRQKVKPNGDIHLLDESNILIGFFVLPILARFIGFLWSNIRIDFFRYSALGVGVIAVLIVIKYMLNWPSIIIHVREKKITFRKFKTQRVEPYASVQITVRTVTIEKNGKQREEHWALLASIEKEVAIPFYRGPCVEKANLNAEELSNISGIKLQK